MDRYTDDRYGGSHTSMPQGGSGNVSKVGYAIMAFSQAWTLQIRDLLIFLFVILTA
jgi:hypothetical protein